MRYALKTDRPKLNWLEAEHEAQENWNTWKSSFESEGPFNKMPVIADIHGFQSFLYEYSVGRGFTRADWLRFRDAALALEAVSSHEQLHQIAFKVLNEKRPPNKMRRSGSMCSKLLSLWRPSRYPMMDSLAKKGLQRSLIVPRGRGLHTNPDNAYAHFSSAIFAFSSLIAGEMVTRISMSSASSEAMRLRIIDNALMSIGQVDLDKSS